MLGLPPLQIWIKKDAMAAHRRMRDSRNWASEGTIAGHAKIVELVEQEIAISTLRVNKVQDRLRWNRKLKPTVPIREE